MSPFGPLKPIQKVGAFARETRDKARRTGMRIRFWFNLVYFLGLVIGTIALIWATWAIYHR